MLNVALLPSISYTIFNGTFFLNILTIDQCIMNLLFDSVGAAAVIRNRHRSTGLSGPNGVWTANVLSQVCFSFIHCLKCVLQSIK